MKDKSLVRRLTSETESKSDFNPNLPTNRWQLFWDTLKNRTSMLIKINLLALLFCLPALIILVIAWLIKATLGSILPFSGNIGIGYPPVSGVREASEAVMFSVDLQMFLILIPFISLAMVGIGAAFNLVKKLVWGESFAVVPNFFRSVRENAWHMVWLGAIIGISLLLFRVNLDWTTDEKIHIFFRVIGFAVNVIQLLLILGIVLFGSTQTVTYKLSFRRLARNSLVFAVGLIPLNIVFLAASALLPGGLFLLGSSVDFLMSLAIIIFALFGIAVPAMIWTLYSHFIFDRFLNDRIPGAVVGKGLQKKSKPKQAPPPKFQNPKKRKPKPVSEGAPLTALPTSFSRADLQKLAEEKATLDTEEAEEAEEAQDQEDVTPDESPSAT